MILEANKRLDEQIYPDLFGLTSVSTFGGCHVSSRFLFLTYGLTVNWTQSRSSGTVLSHENTVRFKTNLTFPG